MESLRTYFERHQRERRAFGETMKYVGQNIQHHNKAGFFTPPSDVDPSAAKSRDQQILATNDLDYFTFSAPKIWFASLSLSIGCGALTWAITKRLYPQRWVPFVGVAMFGGFTFGVIKNARDICREYLIEHESPLADSARSLLRSREPGHSLLAARDLIVVKQERN